MQYLEHSSVPNVLDVFREISKLFYKSLGFIDECMGNNVGKLFDYI